jgi:hypothetical protein
MDRKVGMQESAEVMRFSDEGRDRIGKDWLGPEQRAFFIDNSESRVYSCYNLWFNVKPANVKNPTTVEEQVAWQVSNNEEALIE